MGPGIRRGAMLPSGRAKSSPRGLSTANPPVSAPDRSSLTSDGGWQATLGLTAGPPGRPLRGAGGPVTGRGGVQQAAQYVVGQRLD